MDDPAAIDKLLDARLRTVQIIAAALIAGVVAFAGVVLFSPANNQGAAPNGQGPLVTYVALGVFAVALLVWAIVPNLIAGQAVAKIAAGTWTVTSGRGEPPADFATDGGKSLSENGPRRGGQSSFVPSRRAGTKGDSPRPFAELLVVYQTRSIVAGALLEGPAFLAGVAYMTERQGAALGVVACAVLLMLITFPTRGRVQSWLEKQRQTIDTTRQFGGMGM